MVLSILFAYTKPFTPKKGRGALVVPLPSKIERAQYLQIPTENKSFACGTCFLGMVGKDFEKQHVSSCTSRHV